MDGDIALGILLGIGALMLILGITLLIGSIIYDSNDSSYHGR